jgi:hypothetical protein
MLKSVSGESFWHAFEREKEMAQEESEEFLVLSLNAVMPRFKLRTLVSRHQTHPTGQFDRPPTSIAPWPSSTSALSTSSLPIYWYAGIANQS